MSQPHRPRHRRRRRHRQGDRREAGRRRLAGRRRRPRGGRRRPALRRHLARERRGGRPAVRGGDRLARRRRQRGRKRPARAVPRGDRRGVAPHARREPARHRPRLPGCAPASRELVAVSTRGIVNFTSQAAKTGGLLIGAPYSAVQGGRPLPDQDARRRVRAAGRALQRRRARDRRHGVPRRGAGDPRPWLLDPARPDRTPGGGRVGRFVPALGRRLLSHRRDRRRQRRPRHGLSGCRFSPTTCTSTPGRRRRRGGGTGDEVLRAAEAAGVHGFVWKAHEQHTPRLCAALPPSPVRAFGSASLNPWSTRDDVLEALDDGARWLWGPTISAAGEIGWELELPATGPSSQSALRQRGTRRILATGHLGAAGEGAVRPARCGEPRTSSARSRTRCTCRRPSWWSSPRWAPPSRSTPTPSATTCPDGPPSARGGDRCAPGGGRARLLHLGRRPGRHRQPVRVRRRVARPAAERSIGDSARRGARRRGALGSRRLARRATEAHDDRHRRRRHGRHRRRLRTSARDLRRPRRSLRPARATRSPSSRPTSARFPSWRTSRPRPAAVLSSPRSRARSPGSCSPTGCRSASRSPSSTAPRSRSCSPRTWSAPRCSSTICCSSSGRRRRRSSWSAPSRRAAPSRGGPSTVRARPGSSTSPGHSRQSWVRPGYRVNIVAPGVIGTPFLGDDTGPLAEWVGNRVPAGRIGSPGGGRGGRAVPDRRRARFPDGRADRRRRRRGGARMTSSPVELRFTTKAEAVYDEIRSRILRGILPPASPLNQDALAPELGVSVTPVREAVRRLEAEGLVQVHAHRSVVVSAAQPHRAQRDLRRPAAARSPRSGNRDRRRRARRRSRGSSGWRAPRSAATRSSRRRSTARSTARSTSSRATAC